MEPIRIGRDNGMTILEKLTINSSDQSDNNATSALNQIEPNRQIFDWTLQKVSGAGEDTPIGYALNKSGSLISLANQEWVPSI